MKFLNKYLIVLIFFLALLLRVFVINQNVPPSLNWDEASLGYNAYSILKTGKDEWGRFLPLTFEAFGDYKLPGYIYTLVPFIGLLGLNEFAVRLPSIIFGAVSVIFLYLIVVKITNDKKWALLSVSLFAISPWHFFLSRIALEANLALSFFLIAFYFLVLGLKKQFFLMPASLLFGLSIFTYNSARIFVPLFLLFFMILFWKQIKKTKISLFAALIFAIFLGVGFYLAVFQDSSARYYWVRILDEGAINYLDQMRNNSHLPSLITKLVYNRYVYFIASFTQNYLKHFSIQFLAISGGSNYQFSLQNMGLIYLIELPLLVLGSYKLLKNKIGWIFLVWVLIAPIPSALTREAPHVLRAIFMLGGIQIITSFGLLEFIRLFRKKRIFIKPILAVLVISILLNAGVYFNSYFNDYSLKYSESWQYGYKQVVSKVLENYDKYPKIYISKKYGEPHIFYLFFSAYSPLKYQESETLVRYPKSNWRWVDRLDKIYFVNDWEIVDLLKNERDALVVTSPGSTPENGKHLDTINFLDGSKAFEIIEI